MEIGGILLVQPDPSFGYFPKNQSESLLALHIQSVTCGGVILRTSLTFLVKPSQAFTLAFLSASERVRQEDRHG